MKILHIGYGYPPKWMGAGPVVYLHHLALAQRAAGHTVVAACASDEVVPGRPAYDPAVVDVDGVAYVPLRNRPTLEHDRFRPWREVHDEACERAFRHVLREVAPDVVHVHNLVGLSFDVLRVAQEAGCAVVMSLHNYFPLCSRDDLFFADAEPCSGPTGRSCARCLGTMLSDDPYRARLSSAVEALNGCDLLLPVSARVAQLYREQGVSDDRLLVEHIGSAIATELWDRHGSDRVERARGSGQSGLVVEAGDRTVTPLKVVFFGAALPRKGLMLVLQAAARIAGQAELEVHVLSRTDGPQGDSVRAALDAMEPAAAACFVFRGAYSQRDLVDVLPQMDVAVITPRWEDNGPQTVMEALGAGLPVIATRMGGIPDFVIDGHNGRLVDEGDVEALADALVSAATDRRLLERWRAGISPPRSIETHATRLEAIYQDVLTTKRSVNVVPAPALS